ncbi:MAG TPA: hypothetical protein VMQ65_09895 [Candidatus Limnocylindria bacterium]|nr:hypothetical protein [Candidatus Limnocylindria bacterium]
MSWRELVDAAEAVRAAAFTYDASLEGLPLAGIGWAAVDFERAQQELDARLGLEEDDAATPWTPIARDPALGARAWLRSAGETGPPDIRRPALVLLEPDTEGRIAASLARFGEGVAVIYLGDGPAGPGRLLRGGGMWGPHVVVVGSSGGNEGTA